MVEGALFIGAAVVGVTEFLKRLYDKDYRGALTVVLAAVIGALVAVFDADLGVVSLTVAQGVMAGLAASGVYKVATQIG